MCSAKIVAKWRQFRRDTGLRLDVEEFHRIYHLRELDEAAARLPRGFDLEFAAPEIATEHAISNMVVAFRERKTRALERCAC